MLTCFGKVCSKNELWSHKRCREKENREIINWPFSNSWLTDLVKCINNKCCMTQSSPAGARSLWSPGNVAKIKDRYFWWIHLHLNTPLPRCFPSLLTYRRSYPPTWPLRVISPTITLIYCIMVVIAYREKVDCLSVVLCLSSLPTSIKQFVTWWC